MPSNSESKKNISGLSFKSLVDRIGSESDSLYQDSDVFTDDNRSVFYRLSSRLKVRVNRMAIGYKGSTSIFSFLFNLISYLAMRARVFTVLSAVFFEVALGWGNIFKQVIVKNMFWGRGGVFKYAVQIFSVIIVVSVLFSGFFRVGSTVQTGSLTAQGSPVIASDLLTQRGSSITQKPENRGQTEPETYIVKSGDTLESIATRFGRSSSTIMWSNNLGEYDFIHPGDELTIPQGDGVLVTAKSGDTVETLAKKYNSNPQLIIEQNYMVEPYEIRSGDEIFVPDGRPPEPPKPATSVYSGIVVTRPSYSIPSSPAVPGVGRFLSWPVQGGRGYVSQCYSGWHNGIDIADSGYPNLVASASGRVTFAGCQSGACPAFGYGGGYGLAWTVVVDHGNGLSSVYGHMNTISVRTGQSVSTGQVLGQMGRSGTAYGVHIHFMLLSGSNWRGINPSPYMRNSICGY